MQASPLNHKNSNRYGGSFVALLLAFTLAATSLMPRKAEACIFVIPGGMFIGLLAGGIIGASQYDSSAEQEEQIAVGASTLLLAGIGAAVGLVLGAGYCVYDIVAEVDTDMMYAQDYPGIDPSLAMAVSEGAKQQQIRQIALNAQLPELAQPQFGHYAFAAPSLREAAIPLQIALN